jgi:hypothetical protein
MFPIVDEVCTESQISIKYCGNCGRNGHHAVSSKSYHSHTNGHSNINIGEGDGGCSYEDNPLYINYQRKTFRRDKINKETLNRHKSTKRENDSYCKFILIISPIARRHNNEIFGKFEDRFTKKQKDEPKQSLLDRVRKAERNDIKEHKQKKRDLKEQNKREVKEHKKLEVKERKKSEAKEHKKRDVKEHVKHSSRDYLGVDDEYSTKVNLSKFTIKLNLSDSVKLAGSKTKKKSVLDRIVMRNKMINNSMFDINF